MVCFGAKITHVNFFDSNEHLGVAHPPHSKRAPLNQKTAIFY